MNVSGISQTLALERVRGLTRSDTASERDGGASARDSSRQVSISKPAALMSKLQTLSQQDPAQFRQVTGALASGLEAASGSRSGTAAEKLKELAAQFAEAMKNGELTAARPEQENREQAHSAAAHAALHAYAQSAAAAADDPAKQALNFAYSLADELSGKVQRAA